MMRTIYKLRVFCIVGLLSIPAVMFAQEDQTLSREMTLEREYDPSVQDANKVNTLPTIKEPEVKKMPIDYSTFTTPAEPQREIGLLPSGSIMADMQYNKRRGYFNFGICAGYMNINGDFGYHLLSTEQDQLNVFFSHRSTNGKVKYIDDLYEGEKIKIKLNDNLGGLNYRHVFDRAALKLGARYGYSGFNYYGHPYVRPVPEDSSVSLESSYEPDTKTNQVNQEISILAGVESKEDADVGYLLDLNYTNFSYKYGFKKELDGITENIFGVKGDLNAAFGGNQRVGVGAIFNYFNYGMPDIPLIDGGLQIPEPSFENYFEGTLSPYYKVEGENWHVKLGANVMYISGDHDKFFVSPNVAADVTVGTKTVLYLDTGGDIRSNSAYQLSRENRYINPWAGALPSKTWLDGTVGLKSGVAPGFWFNLFAGYKITDDDYFFVPVLDYKDFANTSTVLPLNSKLFRGGLEMKYAYQKLFEVTLKGVYNNWDVEDSENWESGPASDFKAYGRPEMEFTAGFTVRPFEELTLGLNYYLATGRETYITTANYSGAYDMKNINELNFSGTYKFNDTFGVYAQLNNILFQKYEVLYGYPLQRFSGMIGVNINF